MDILIFHLSKYEACGNYISLQTIKFVIVFDKLTNINYRKT